MQQIGKSANFSGHFSEYPPSLSKRMARAFVESGQRTRRLSEIQIHCENTLRQTVMEFPAEAAPFFVLQLQQARGKLMERFFGLFALGYVRKRVDDCGYGACLTKYMHSYSQWPVNFVLFL